MPLVLRGIQYEYRVSELEVLTLLTSPHTFKDQLRIWIRFIL